MTPDERAEALFSACVNAVDKHGVVDEVGMQEAVTAILTALRDERRRAMEAAATIAEEAINAGCSDDPAHTFCEDYGCCNIRDIAQAIRALQEPS